ncbi:MAG: hypothetical protein CENE_01359 [Candidatus Celerinatantimonas neptuna]|nr:MAG: hypothetical protein CENE_01359 [Candidatus Celerinatantimonas neptuna]
MGYEWLALISAAIWAGTSLISVTPARHLGAFSYSRWRIGLVTLILTVASLITGGWQTLSGQDLIWLICSGAIGIFIGDTALFACMNRLGPRRANLLFTSNAIFSTILGTIIFHERMQSIQLLGATLLLLAIALAILFGHRQQHHAWENVKGSLSIAISLGLIAALGQSLGSILAKPVMHGSIDPIAASMVRMLSAFIAHLVLAFFNHSSYCRAQKPMNIKIFTLVFANGFLAMGVGMTLILYALRHGDVGMVSLLSATTPVMILPLLWICTKEPPTRSAWFAATLAVIGSALLIH